MSDPVGTDEPGPSRDEDPPQPGHASPKPFGTEGSLLLVSPEQVDDLQFPSRGGLEFACEGGGPFVHQVESRYRPWRGGLRRLFHEVRDLSVPFEKEAVISARARSASTGTTARKGCPLCLDDTLAKALRQFHVAAMAGTLAHQGEI